MVGENKNDNSFDLETEEQDIVKTEPNLSPIKEESKQPDFEEQFMMAANLKSEEKTLEKDQKDDKKAVAGNE